MRVRVWVFLAAAGILYGQLPFTQPYISDGPLNAASYPEKDWPGAGVAQGSMFVVKGLLLGPTGLVQVNAFPLPTELGGTSMEVTAGGVTLKPYMVYTSFGQVAAILPSRTPVGDARITVSFEGKTSAPASFRVVRSSFGIFTRNEAGSGPGILQNVETETLRPVNALHLPARPGQAMILWGTGLGPVSGDEQAQLVPGDLPFAVDVMVGGKSANVLYRGRSGCCAGIDQIVFEVPAGLQGCRVPVAVRADGIVSNFVTISVAEQGRMCPDPPVISTSDLEKLRSGEALSTARIEIMRLDIEAPRPGMSNLLFELAYASFIRYRQHEFLRTTDAGSYWRAGAPSPGHCLVLTGNSNEDLPLPVHEDPYSDGPSGLRPARLDAGKGMSVSGQGGSKEMWLSNGSYIGLMGGFDPDSGKIGPSFLQPGTLTVDNGAGGKDVGAFKTSVTFPPPVEWSNQAQIENVRRSEDLTVSWKTANAVNELVTIVAVSGVRSGTTSVAMCTESAAAGRMTIPSWILSALLPSDEADGIPLGYLVVASSPLDSASRVSVPGMDASVLQYIDAKARMVAFR